MLIEVVYTADKKGHRYNMQPKSQHAFSDNGERTQRANPVRQFLGTAAWLQTMIVWDAQ